MPDYPPTKILPWSHQIELWNISKNKPHFYIAHDMGAGKTKEAIDYANGINAQSILIICPKKVILHWPKQLKKHSHTYYKPLPLNKGTILQKASQVKKFIKQTTSPYAVIINYESFWRPPLGAVYNRRNRMIKPGELFEHDWDLMICDEAHRLKSPASAQSWGAMRLAQKAKHRRWLSGTPMDKPTDVYAQYRALDSSIFGRNYTYFKTRYCILDPRTGRYPVGYKNLKELNEKFYSIAHYVKIDDVLDMPKTQDVELLCELDQPTMQLYREFEQEFVAEHNGKEISADNVLVKMLREAEISAGILKLDDGSKKTIDNNKIDTVLDKIEDLPRQEPIVIFYRFTPEAARIKPELKKLKRIPCEISGQMDEQERFESGGADTAVVQIRAGGEGLDILKRARYAFFLSLTYSLSEYKQAKARIWRPGQTRKCIFYHVVANKTMDIKILKAIKKKKEIVDYILEDFKNNTYQKTGTNNA